MFITALRKISTPGICSIQQCYSCNLISFIFLGLGKLQMCLFFCWLEPKCNVPVDPRFEKGDSGFSPPYSGMPNQHFYRVSSLEVSVYRRPWPAPKEVCVERSISVSKVLTEGSFVIPLKQFFDKWQSLGSQAHFPSYCGSLS